MHGNNITQNCNNMEHFVLTASENILVDLEYKKKIYGKGVIKFDLSTDMPMADFIDGKWHPVIGNVILKRVVDGSFKGYKKFAQAVKKAKELQRHYQEELKTPGYGEDLLPPVTA